MLLKLMGGQKRDCLRPRMVDKSSAFDCPEGENLNNWLAINVDDFYQQLTILYNALTEFCTIKSCPHMTAGPNYKYLWCDGKDYPKPVDLPACEYIKLLFEWVPLQLNEDNILSSSSNDFLSKVKVIMSRLYRIYCHVYHHHMEDIKDTQAHWNTSLKLFITFNYKYNLIPEDQIEPLREIVNKIKELQS